MSLWSKVRSQVDLGNLRSEKDRSEHDTVLSRAMLRYYGEDVPAWLQQAQAARGPGGGVATPVQAQYGAQYSSQSSGGAPTATRTSLDFLQPRTNPIANLSGGTPAPRTGGRLGQKLRKSNW